jgi:hypothetical protein
MFSWLPRDAHLYVAPAILVLKPRVEDVDSSELVAVLAAEDLRHLGKTKKKKVRFAPRTFGRIRGNRAKLTWELGQRRSYSIHCRPQRYYP